MTLLPLILWAAWLFPAQAGGQIIQGRVVHADTTAPIPGARVEVTLAAPSGPDRPTREWTTTTDAGGRFRFDGLPIGTYSAAVSVIGYVFVRRSVELTDAVPVDLLIPLTEGAGTYRETVNVGADKGESPPLEAMSRDVLGPAALQDLRGVATDDPLRAVQALPGVATGDDLRSDFSVRGSAFRHTGVVIDGTPTPLLLHTVRGEANTGSIAMINTDVLSRAALLSGPHARRHGDWMGASLEFDMREGSRDRRGLRGAVSGTSASMVAEGPIGAGGRGSWIVSVRRSYLDWLIRQVSDFDSTLGFHDAYAKVVFDLTPRHQIQVMSVAGDATYRERDPGRTNGLNRARSRSTLGSVAWRFTGDRLAITNRVSFTGSDFRNTGVLSQELGRGYTQSILWRLDLVRPIAGGWLFEGGTLRERQRMNEIARVFRAAPNQQVTVLTSRDVSPRTTLTSAYAHLSRQTQATGLSAGIRVSDRTMSNRPVVSPWVLAERRRERWSFRGGLGASGQFPDPLFVFPAGATIGPERTVGGDVGVGYQLDGTTEVRATSFYRRESNGLRLAAENRLNDAGGRQFATVFPTYESPLDTTSRGVELVLSRRAPMGLTGWIGYMWAHTRARDPGTGEAFDGDFDQRHTLNVVVTQRLSYRTNLGAKLRIGSNVPITGYFSGEPDAMRLSASRNDVRLPTYARLDIRAARTFTVASRRLTLFVEVMNVLRRSNYGQAEGGIRTNLEAVGFLEELIPFVPSAGLLIEF